MQKIIFILIMFVTLIITSVLYGTHTLIVEEKEAITLEQAYMTQYPQTIPDVMFDPMPTHIPL